MPVEAEAAVTGISQLAIALAVLGLAGTGAAVYKQKLENAEAALAGAALVGVVLVASIVTYLVGA